MIKSFVGNADLAIMTTSKSSEALKYKSKKNS